MYGVTDPVAVTVALPSHAPPHDSGVALVVNVIFETVINLHLGVLFPQEFMAVTQIFPLLPAVAVMEVVFCPEMIVQPPGTVQL